MRACGYVPDLTLCSNAKRARETLAGLAGQTDTGRVVYLDKLYSEDATGYLEIIVENGAAESGAGHRPQSDDGGSRRWPSPAQATTRRRRR